jgi:hypothetical protein
MASMRAAFLVKCGAREASCDLRVLSWSHGFGACGDRLAGAWHGGAAKRSPLGLRGMTHLKDNEAPVICRGYVADASHVS